MDGSAMLLGISVVGLVIGMVNATEHNIGVRLVNRDEFALTRVHIEFAADVRMMRARQQRVG